MEFTEIKEISSLLHSSLNDQNGLLVNDLISQVVQSLIPMSDSQKIQEIKRGSKQYSEAMQNMNQVISQIDSVDSERFYQVSASQQKQRKYFLQVPSFSENKQQMNGSRNNARKFSGSSFGQKAEEKPQVKYDRTKSTLMAKSSLLAEKSLFETKEKQQRQQKGEALLSKSCVDKTSTASLEKKYSTASEAETNLSFDRQNSNAPTGNRDSSTHVEDSDVTITLMDESYFEFVKVILSKDETLEKVFRIIQQNNLNNLKNFVLKEDPSSENVLTPEHEVKHLESNILYIMTKKFMDEGDEEYDVRPIRLNSLIPRDITYLPPIGFNEASMYEEFEVCKISSLGIAQERVLGIDLTKVYNYSKQFRKLNRDVSLVEKILGADTQSGTKKPFRLIADIREIKKFQGGIEIHYEDKQSTYLVKNHSQTETIHRKLNFLMNWHRSQKEESAEQNKNIKPPKSKGNFFRF